MQPIDTNLLKMLTDIPKDFPALIVCYPRSASTFLGRYIHQRTMKHLRKSHELKTVPGYQIIGTFREPFDAISSFVSMQDYYVAAKSLDEAIDEQIKIYNDSLEFLIDNAKILIDYKTIIKDPEYCVKKISDALSIDIVYRFDYIDQIEDIAYDNFLKSSKATKRYQDVRNMLLGKNLTKSEQLYQMASLLDKTI
jgi:hypothetical protein